MKLEECSRETLEETLCVLEKAEASKKMQSTLKARKRAWTQVKKKRRYKGAGLIGGWIAAVLWADQRGLRWAYR